MRKLLSLSLVAFVALAFGACRDSGEILNPDEVSTSTLPSDCDVVVPDNASTISGGVDAASPGDMVCVTDAESPYVEQVVINKDLTLKGFDGPTVQMPSNPSGFIIPESGQEWEPVVFAFGGSLAAPDVSGSGTVDVSISGFTVDGADLQPDRDKNTRPRLAGILYRNVQSSDGITGNTVENLANGGKENFGVAVYGDSDVTVSSNTITGYERIGIIVSGAESTGRVRNNTVTTDDPEDKNWAPNGIELVAGAQGDVKNNMVSGNLHPGAASGAILVVGTHDVEVKENTATDNDYGVGVFTFFEDNPSADDNKVIKNDVNGANNWGVIIGTFALGTTANNNKVTNNTLDGDDGDSGVLIFGEANNNKVIRNTFTDFDTNVLDLGDDTKEAANTSPSS